MTEQGHEYYGFIVFPDENQTFSAVDNVQSLFFYANIVMMTSRDSYGNIR